MVLIHKCNGLTQTNTIKYYKYLLLGMMLNLVMVTLSLVTSINGTGNGNYLTTNNDTNVTNNLTGPIELETNHIIDGIPDVIPALEPRFPMPAPSL